MSTSIMKRGSTRALVWIVLIAFTAFSTYVVIQDGYFGFITLAMNDLWGAQVLLDLCIGLTFFVSWMRHDARLTGRNPWPYFIAICTLGSIGALAYLALTPSAKDERELAPA